MAISPTQRTLKYLRANGYECGIVERWIAQARKRIDLFGFIDIIALPPTHYIAIDALPVRGIIGVQSCGQAFSEHDHKIRKPCRRVALRWLDNDGELVLMGWRKVMKYPRTGSKVEVWRPRIKVYTQEDFNV